ncbi:uncharacterized protein LOC129727760 [Wyeomyia smithii]|uniref:uncharacterized protein LOC129727760 n=1 Tax=Wyeomyia smithii TaxID=174621 RepID=UPI002467B447|nr:uncharacterized protein LOC129727760 [Wyeomyia smithii]
MVDVIKDRFWMLLQRDVGLIPEHIINILDFTGYSANCALEAISDDSLKTIESEAREIPQILRIPTSDEEQMKKYFGKFYRNPQNFHILSGEAQQIKMIGACLQQKGIASYMKLEEINRARDKRRKESLPEGNSPEHAARSLAERVHTFYFNRCDGTVKNIDFCNKLSTIQVTAEYIEDGNMVAFVTCPFCQVEKKLRVSQDRTGHWVLANIVSHMNRHLTPVVTMLNASDDSGLSVKKIKKESLDLDDSNDQYNPNAYNFTMTLT